MGWLGICYESSVMQDNVCTKWPPLRPCPCSTNCSASMLDNVFMGQHWDFYPWNGFQLLMPAHVDMIDLLDISNLDKIFKTKYSYST